MRYSLVIFNLDGTLADTDDAGAEAWAETWGPGAVFGLFPMPGDLVYCYGTGTVPAGGSTV